MSTSYDDDQTPPWVLLPEEFAPPPEVPEPAETPAFEPDDWQGPPSEPEPDLDGPAPARTQQAEERGEVHSGVWAPSDPKPGIDAPVTGIAPSGEHDTSSLGSGVAGGGLESDTDRIGHEKTITRRRPSPGAHGTRGKLPPGRGVQWVRASDLISHGTGKLAGRGIDFQKAMSRRVRGFGVAATAGAARGVSQVARRLPPVHAFGRGTGRDTAPTRSPVSMS